MESMYFNGKKCPADYLGDGVYALYDGFSIWLRANSAEFPTDEICLEPSVLAALNRFAEAVKEDI